MNYDQIVDKFIGIGKVQPLLIEEDAKGKYRLVYKEGNKKASITGNKEELERILVEFGGKNPDTCRAPDMFLFLDNSWSSEDINELGHRITKIVLNGQRVTRKSTYPISIPEGCGNFSITKPGSSELRQINLQLKDREEVAFTLSFQKPSEFNSLCEFIFSHNSLKNLVWYVSLLGTESRETGDQCVWKRLKAGDGTKRMVLELIGLNGDHFTECVRQDLFNAAGDMFYSPCQRVTVRKKKEQKIEICMFAAEDGKVDLSKYEVA